MAAETIAHSVVVFNNGALQHFLNGSFDQAIEMLTAACKMFDSYNPGRVAPSAPPPMYAPSIMPGLQFLRDGIPSWSKAEREVDRMVQDKSMNSLLQSRNAVLGSFSSNSLPSTAHSVYNRALILSAEDEDATVLLTNNRYRTRAILFYNLALVYHNVGIHRGVSSALPRALHLYELALESIDQGTNLIEVQKLLMAILNNCGNIYTHFHFLEETQRCFENLRIVLAASTPDMAIDDDYNFFFLNALFQTKELCFAPAA
mmetsp:Transcript_16774/g.27223  ORF Transcript_16774/g.27223 Transcript_16774/m.27223 type:complete len:259 (-) Transcript_16774:487-1263(-)